LSLLAVEKMAVAKELEASALAALTISSKEIVKATISVYESKLKESDHDLKCKKLYEPKRRNAIFVFFTHFGKFYSFKQRQKFTGKSL
jgi:hypothetical protein